MNIATIKPLRDLAQQALQQYSADTAAGSEPPFPQWARDLLDLADEFDRAVQLLVDGTRLMPHSSRARLAWAANVSAFITRIHAKESK